MAPSMPALDRDLKDKPSGASAVVLRAVLTPPTHHHQPLRNSFC
jgi:hypothetical protein